MFVQIFTGFSYTGFYGVLDHRKKDKNQTCQVSRIWRDFLAYFFIHAFTQALRTFKWIPRIFLKKHRISIKWRYFSKFTKKQPKFSKRAIMSKVAAAWQFSLPCIMSNKCLLMKRAHFVGVICCWWRPYLNWQTGPLPKATLLFFLHFLSLNSYLKDMKETFLPLTLLFFQLRPYRKSLEHSFQWKNLGKFARSPLVIKFQFWELYFPKCWIIFSDLFSDQGITLYTHRTSRDEWDSFIIYFCRF